MAYLLILSLGPVQEFIAAARKTRDLWFGSALLSEIATAAARALQANGADLIFPAPDSLGDGAAPNKIVAIVPGDPAPLIERAVGAARQRLGEARDQAYRAARNRDIERLVDWDLLDRQLDGFLEHYAAWHPYDAADPDAYRQARAAAERLLAGRKALRDFGPAPGRDGVPKSSLDPGRETVLAPLPRDQAARDAIVRRLARADIKVGEQLDGVSLVKRLAEARRFVSLSRIAIDPLLRRLDGKGQLADLRALAGALAEGDARLVDRFDANQFRQYAAFPFDTQLFYNDGSDEEGATDEEMARARAFFTRFRDLSGREDPPTYLAVLAADGDRVGRAIGAMGTPDEHRAFSRAGMQFARAADGIVARRQGALVYSGGDDVLALLPLDTAIDCAAELRDTFMESLRALNLREAPTLSVGIAIGYYSEPMSTLLEWARAAERHAKGTRDALAVSLHTRAGSAQTLTRYRWSDEPLRIWRRWIAWYREDVVPDGAAYELRDLAREARALDRAGDPTRTARFIVPEARRILGRKRGLRGTRALTADEIAAILSALHRARESAPPGPAAGEQAIDGLETLVSTMIIARRLADAQDAAGAPREEPVHV